MTLIHQSSVLNQMSKHDIMKQISNGILAESDVTQGLELAMMIEQTSMTNTWS
jgi:hypothetical protein